MKKLFVSAMLFALPASCFAFSFPSILGTPSSSLLPSLSNTYVMASVGQPSGNVPGFAKTIPALAGAIGYKIGNIAVEAGYGSIGRVEFANGASVNGRGYGVAALYNFSPYGKIVPFVKVGENRIMNVVSGVSTQEWSPSYGLGFSVPLNANVSVRATFERYQKEARNATSVGIVYGF